MRMDLVTFVMAGIVFVYFLQTIGVIKIIDPNEAVAGTETKKGISTVYQNGSTKCQLVCDGVEEEDVIIELCSGKPALKELEDCRKALSEKTVNQYSFCEVLNGK